MNLSLLKHSPVLSLVCIASKSTARFGWRSGSRFLPIICLLLGTTTMFGGNPQFADFPDIFVPSTNTTGASKYGDTVRLRPDTGGSNAPVSKNISIVNLTNGMENLDDKYLLAVGDRLSFRIVEDEEDPKSLFVTDSGDLEVSYIGRYPAVGLTCKQLARKLKVEFEKEYYYQATVIIAVDVMTRSRGRVYLVGPVRSPGPQDIPNDEVLTLSKAILRSGGFTDFADKRSVKVTRAGKGGDKKEETFTVNVEDILEKGKSGTDIPLQADDLIYIPDRLIRF